jgi:DNA repair exonuclease SbcCD ATPase subunit
VSYLRKPTLPQQQDELQELIDERLKNEEIRIRQRVYQWLNDNRYFVDNELFDFYFCVAQNISAVEVLGGSGEKIVKAKMELEESVEAYTTQVVDTSNWINEQLTGQLQNVQKNQQKLDTKLLEVLEGLAKEHRNLQAISTGLVNSISTLMARQRQLLVQTETARKFAFQSVIIAWIIPVMALLGWLAILLFFSRL